VQARGRTAVVLSGGNIAPATFAALTSDGQAQPEVGGVWGGRPPEASTDQDRAVGAAPPARG
jgi:hypothetical protein